MVSPTVRQRAALVGLLGLQCELYNAALEDRRGAWRWEHRSVSYVDQCRTLTHLRGVRPEVLAAGVKVCRGTLKRLDRAFAGFYRRCPVRAAAGLSAVPVSEPLGFAAAGRPLRVEPGSGVAASASDGDRRLEGAPASPDPGDA